MSEYIDQHATFSIDEVDYEVSFTVEASSFNSFESFEHFGNKQLEKITDAEFELHEIGLVETEEGEVKLTKELEKKLRAELHEWISDHSDELANEIN